MEKFKSVPFKEWIREQIKMNINPILYKKGFKREEQQVMLENVMK